MSYTKRQFVRGAFEELGLGAYAYDLGSEEMQFGLRRLDAMLAEWNGRGIRLSYPIPSSPENSDLDEETSVPDRANETIICNLAVRLAPSYGKTVAMETKANARRGYNTILAVAAFPPEMQMPNTMPAGAGQKAWRDSGDPFLGDPEDPLQAGNDAAIDFE